FYRYTGRAEMSALGQKRTHAVQQSKSALPPIATANADSRKTSCTLYPCGGGNVRFPTLIRTAMPRSDRAALPDGPDRGQMKSPRARQAINGHTVRLVARWPMLGANVRFGSKAAQVHVRFTPESDAERVHLNVRLEARRSTERSARPHPSLQDQGRQYHERSTSTLQWRTAPAALVPAFAHLRTTSQRIAALHCLRMAEA